MKITLGLMFGAVLVFCGSAQEVQLYRILSSTATRITSLRANTITWTNAATGVTSIVQTATSMSGEWDNYGPVLVTNRLMAFCLTNTAPFRGMVLVPAGSFAMGDAFGEGYDDELPVHSVYVSEFYIEKREVSKALWDKVKTWGVTNGYVFTGSAKGSNYPVLSVTWFDAVRWCNARSQKEGLKPCYYTDAAMTTPYKTGQVNPYVNWNASGYRLPTEVEWEKAARGGASGRRFSWSDTDNISHARANYSAASPQAYDLSYPAGYNPAYTNGGAPYSAPVDSFAPNGYGLYDMVGNVFEWCWDWYQADWYGQNGARQNDSRGPAGPATYRVERGGGWMDAALLCRVSYRQDSYATFADGNDGFRCVRKP